MEATNVVIGMKREATSLAEMLKRDFGREIKRSDALERVARLRGFENWDTAVACAGREKDNTESSVLTRREQFTQLFAFHAGINNGRTMVDAISILKDQPNKEAATGWGRVQFDDEVRNKLSEIFLQTGLFDEDIITISSMVDGYAEWGSSFLRVLDYVKETIN